MPTWSPTPAAIAPSLIPSPVPSRPDPRLERVLHRWLAAGVLAVLLVPALRGSSAWLGWWPLWLVGMPAVAWWALHRFRLPARRARAAKAPCRRPGRQARRCLPARIRAVRQAA